MAMASITLAHNCHNTYFPTFFKEFIQILINTQSKRKVSALDSVRMEKEAQLNCQLQQIHQGRF
jgi:hypothetical protein